LLIFFFPKCRKAGLFYYA